MKTRKNFKVMESISFLSNSEMMNVVIISVSILECLFK